jgi:splicing factor 4
VVKSGNPLEAEDEYKSFKLDDSNKGFKLLKQAGWTEGKGLGAKGTGIVTPISG